MNINPKYVLQKLIENNHIKLDELGYIKAVADKPNKNITINGKSTTLRQWCYFCLYCVFSDKKLTSLNANAVDPREL